MLTEANGLLYMRARYYSPDMMRFINEDIVTGDISNSNSLNRYSYVEGNPVTMVDPFGLCPQAKDAFDSIFDMEKIHGILDAVGFIPGLGDVCDGINALLYLSEGDMGNVALSALALLPLGDLLKGGKYTAKIVGKLDDIGGAVFKYLGKNCDNLLTAASKKVDDVLSFASKKCDNFFNFFRKQSDDLVEAVAKHGDDAVDSVLKTSYGKSSSNITKILANRPELTGTNREKLLSTVQDNKLATYINEVYRPGASIGDGGTADALIAEFNAGNSTHLLKAQERLKGINKFINTGNLGLNDLDIAEALRDDLEYAIGLFK